MRFFSLLTTVLAISHTISATSSSRSTVNNAGGYGAELSLEAGRYEAGHHAHIMEDAKPFKYDPFDIDFGPSKWAANFPDKSCGGFSQSPVALPAYVNAKPDTAGILKPLSPSYGTPQPANSLTIVNTGHALQINMPSGLFLKGGALGTNPYNVLQMHMHGRSEHTVSGAAYPLEIHIVHSDDTRFANDSRKLAVLGILVQESAQDNPALTPITNLLPSYNTALNTEGNNATIATSFGLTNLLPTNLDYYHYNGSLTTPPCSEQVVWHVLTTPITASREQILRLTAPFGTVGNSRPVQALNGRTVLVTSYQTPSPSSTGSTLTLSFMSVLSVVAAILNMQ